MGGKNGFGFKLVLIWSKEGSIETIDHTRGLKYVQNFTSNLDEIGKTLLTSISHFNHKNISLISISIRNETSGYTKGLVMQ